MQLQGQMVTFSTTKFMQNWLLGAERGWILDSTITVQKTRGNSKMHGNSALSVYDAALPAKEVPTWVHLLCKRLDLRLCRVLPQSADNGAQLLSGDKAIAVLVEQLHRDSSRRAASGAATEVGCTHDVGLQS